MKIFEVIDDGYYVAPTEEDFREGFLDLVGEDQIEMLDGYKEISESDAFNIQMRLLDDDGYSTGDTISLLDALDEYVKGYGEVFGQLAWFNI